MSKPQEPPTQPQGAQGMSLAAAGSQAASELKKIAAESWMSPAKVILSAVVVAVIVGLILYYTVTTLLQVHPVGSPANAQNGIFDSANWLTWGGGLFFFVMVIIVLTCGGACIGMSWKNNGQAAMWAAGAALLIGVLYYFVFVSAKDNRKDQFALWSILATIIAIALHVYGWWQIRAMSKDNTTRYSAEEQNSISERASWATYTLGVGGVFAIIVAAGLWKIYSALG